VDWSECDQVMCLLGMACFHVDSCLSFTYSMEIQMLNESVYGRTLIALKSKWNRQRNIIS
jgi:hypothetical protein